MELFVDNPYSLLHVLGVDKGLTPDHLRILEKIGRYRVERGRPVLLPKSYIQGPRGGENHVETFSLKLILVLQ